MPGRPGITRPTPDRPCRPGLSSWSAAVSTELRRFGELDVKNTNAWQQALATMGPLMLGVGVGDAEQQQFANGQLWTAAPGARANAEDHCIILCGYQPGIYWAWTWGSIQGMTPAWFELNAYEVWGAASQTWVNSVRGTDPEGVDLADFGQQFAATPSPPAPSLIADNGDPEGRGPLRFHSPAG